MKPFKKKTRYKVYDLTFIINEKEYHYIMVCHKLDKNQNIASSQFTNPFEFSIQLNPLQTREESKAMFRPMIENNEYTIKQITKSISYEECRIKKLDNCSTATFSKFLNGTSKYNKKYTILSD